MPGTSSFATPDTFPPDTGVDFGQSALLLVESLLHGLVERSIIPLDEAIEIAVTACDVLQNANEEKGLDAAECARAAAPLKAICASLRIDADRITTQD